MFKYAKAVLKQYFCPPLSSQAAHRKLSSVLEKLAQSYSNIKLSDTTQKRDDLSVSKLSSLTLCVLTAT